MDEDFLTLRHGCPRTGALSCVVLSHNEEPLIPPFLDHYRNLGIEQFLFVDDRSTDQTADLLGSQPDVAVFEPIEGSTYRKHYREWRSQLLDRYCAGQWVMVPDIDEHIVFATETLGEKRDLPWLIDRLEAEGADAYVATMVDMYSKQLEAFDPSRTLLDCFPLFDAAESYHRILSAKGGRANYPTPNYIVFGGMRQRLFRPILNGDFPRLERLLRTSGAMQNDTRGIKSWMSMKLARETVKMLLKRQRFKTNRIFNMSKVPLLKWQKGGRFSGGAHSVSFKANPSQSRGALLHYNFSGGLPALRHKCNRGQHAGGSAMYRALLETPDLESIDLTYGGTNRYTGFDSLGDLVRHVK